MKSQLSHTALPSSQELEQYLNGTLDPARSHEIELLAEHSDLVAEAIEGYSAVPAFDGVPEWSGVVTTGKSAATTGSKLSLLSRGWWHLNGWIVGLIMGGSMVWMFAESGEGVTKTQMNQLTDQIQRNAFTSETSISQVSDNENNLINIPGEIIQATNSMITPTQLVDVSDRRSAGVSGNDTDVFKPQIPDDTAKTTTIAADNLPVGINRDNDGIRPSQYAAVKIIHVLSYKVADYTELRSRNWNSFSTAESGVPAKYETESEMKKNNENETKAIPYIEYLTQCISAYHDKKYSLASEKLSVIQAQYPEDVNAMFYNAMSYYHIGKYEAAMVNYDLTIKNRLTVFREEATFYKAKALKALGRNDEANALFSIIAGEKGFYSRNAEIELGN